MNYGKAIRIARAIRGMNRQDLAVTVKVDSSYITLLEQGKRQPSPKVFQRISVCLDVPLHVLMLLGSDPNDWKNGVSRIDAELLGRFILEGSQENLDSRRKGLEG